MDPEDDLIAISALQHLAFCERQCALIHVEQAWAENRLTAEGRVLHKRVHDAGAESRPDVRVVRSLRLRSLALGLTGVADVVEFHADPAGVASRPPRAGAWLEIDQRRTPPATRAQTHGEKSVYGRLRQHSSIHARELKNAPSCPDHAAGPFNSSANVVPDASLRSSTRSPPCARAISRARLRPRPAPSMARVRDGSAR